MKTNFHLLFYIKKQKNYIKRLAPIYMRITVAGKRSEVTTGRECEPERWSSKTGRMIGSKEDAKSFNGYLDHLQAQVYQAHKTLTEMGEVLTADCLKNSFLGKEEKTHTLLEAIKNHNQKMEALVDKEYASGTLDRFEVLENHVASFLQTKYKAADISVKRWIMPLSAALNFT
jgi:hypothetical protein